MIMLTGIAVLGLLAGSMASFFRIDSSSTPVDAARPHRIRAIPRPVRRSRHSHARFRLLRDQLSRLTVELDRFTSSAAAGEEEPPTRGTAY